MTQSKKYKVLGLMSGSSLDGLDICYAEIDTFPAYTFKIIAAETIPYSTAQIQWIRSIDKNGDLREADEHFAEIFSSMINKFIAEKKITEIDFIASHGHTVFHDPAEGRTCQLGNGKLIAKKTGHRVISNFRQADIDAGGQGAPLVPVCDEIFFPEYHACLNVGGIANISFHLQDERVGFDICAANQLLNYCAQKLGMDYDAGGEIAANGTVDDALLSILNSDPYFDLDRPKSMDNHYIKEHFLSILENSNLSIEDVLSTATEHIAQKIADVINYTFEQRAINKSDYNLLVTGGGAYNFYLLKRIENICAIKIHLPAKEIINYKEALAMCLMGVLRMENKTNFLPSVTGARKAVVGGEVSDG